MTAITDSELVKAAQQAQDAWNLFSDLVDKVRSQSGGGQEYDFHASITERPYKANTYAIGCRDKMLISIRKTKTDRLL